MLLILMTWYYKENNANTLIHNLFIALVVLVSILEIDCHFQKPSFRLQIMLQTHEYFMQAQVCPG